MRDWQIVPEIIGCNAALRVAITRAMDAVSCGSHFVVEGEAGSGRRLLARSASRRTYGAQPLFSVDCRIFGDRADEMLFGESSGPEIRMTGAVLLLHAEALAISTQRRLAKLLEKQPRRRRGEGLLMMLTSTTELGGGRLDPELAEVLLHVRVPPLRERLEDLRAIAEAFLCSASPYERICCSQALIDRFCGYDWPGNISELRSVLRRMLLENHHGLLDLRHLPPTAMWTSESLTMLREGAYQAACQATSASGSLQ
jgi:DNA-binding NtrC family response regulator